jgi:hypothetical protein
METAERRRDTGSMQRGGRRMILQVFIPLRAFPLFDRRRGIRYAAWTTATLAAGLVLVVILGYLVITL